MRTTVKKISLLLVVMLLLALLIATVAVSAQQNAAFAAGEDAAVEKTLEIAQEQTKQTKGWTAAIVIAVVAAAGAIGMALAIIKAIDGIARQPEAESKIRTTLMLGLVFIETAVIYALIVAILLVFVL